ncbi:FliH/SctL family protein [Sinomonas atrocyanea]|uniref:FliH/SctL family protein n=1 Tax=Sinomonas atrocyanea TaxID=37927 RepID=UPI00277E909B|nr:FliH/SctL family protein [Sinomonas atrocyanea]MDQ0261020.1 flagellar assembly protein FliH [Sinomonas atrocyanea]MDR6622025.1 flagellar assembly protein FliH [Sinomonas atrocyanea]
MSTDTVNLGAPRPSAHVPGAPVRPVVFPDLDPAGESEGYARGHAAGYAAGLRRAAAEAAEREEERRAEHAAALAAARSRVEAAVSVLAAAARALDSRTAPVLAEAEAQLTAAALTVAEAVIGRELGDAPGSARAALARALSAPDAAAVLAVRLHPADLALLGQAAGSVSVPAGVTLEPDPSLARGDAVAVYPDGELDARIGTALARAAAALTASDHEAPPPEAASPGARA